MAILYVETNFPLTIAEGQDRRSDEFLAAIPDHARLVMPSICFMESLSVIEFKLGRFQEEIKLLDRLFNDATRDQTSMFAGDFAKHLEAAKVAGGLRINDVKARLESTLKRLAVIAEAIPFSPTALQETLDRPLMKDPTDQLILASILEHSARFQDIPKGFLTHDDHFDDDAVRERLRTDGIKFFRDATSARGWLHSLRPPEPGEPGAVPPP
jgi:hypothetical protein